MSRKTQAISDELLKACQLELKKQGRRGENGRRLQAIISAKEHGIQQVARMYNISRETLMRWIRNFKQGGCKAFDVKPGRGRRPKLTDVQKLEVQEYGSQVGATLTSKALQLWIEERFGVELSIPTAHRLLQKLGFSYITPRPSHPKKDPAAQEAFKKKP